MLSLSVASVLQITILQVAPPSLHTILAIIIRVFSSLSPNYPKRVK